MPPTRATSFRIRGRLRPESAPDIAGTPRGIALAERHGISVGLTTLWRFLAGQKITRKKKSPCRRARPPRCSGRAPRRHSPPAGARSGACGVHRRDLGHDHYDAPLWPRRPRVAARGAGTGTARSLDGDHPGLRRGRLLVAGLRSTGITAPCVFDGAVNGARCRAVACPGESRGRADVGANPAAGRSRPDR
jgi:hypothetical protein